MKYEKPLAQMASEHGLKPETLRYRLKKGWDLETALSVPVSYNKKEIIGNRYDRLLVKERISGTRNYLCQCDCGNKCVVYYGNLTSGRQRSCGCLNAERKRARLKDLSNQIINNVYVSRRVEDAVSESGLHAIQYQCCCMLCGREFIARASNLRSGNTSACGCQRNKWRFIDLTGTWHEFCTVLRRMPDVQQPAGGKRVIFECQCCCGNIYSDWSYTIAHGRSNCGCKHIGSAGETQVKEWLDEHHVLYVQQHWFADLRGKNNRPLYFDFAIIGDDGNPIGLIEYQGKQHYEECHRSIKDFGKEQRERTDPAKRVYCAAHHIPLFEIAYNQNVNVECESILHTLYHEDTVPSSELSEKV